MTVRGLFVGLSTLDVVQLVERLPAPDEKVRGLDDMLAAGGPATNAAVGFAASGEASTTLLTRAGDGPQWALMESDLQACGVEVVRAPTRTGHRPTCASILVTAASGERAVISTQDRSHLGGATHPDPTAVVEALPVEDFDVIELDGHEADLAETVARRARAAGVPVVFDGGSWKATTPALLPHVDAAVVSSSFRPEGCDGAGEVLDFLLDHGVAFAAVTRGGAPILWATRQARGEHPVESVDAVDTLGAGDFFHGGFAHHVAMHGLDASTFPSALTAGARLAARSITLFGTRAWLR